MSEFEEWYSKNGTFNNIVDEAVWTDMERLFTFWQKTEKENARLRETIIELCQYYKYELNDNDEFFVCDCKGHLMAKKALEKSE